MWAGDSRLYRLRHGVLTQITRDHNPIGDLLDDGVITEQTAQARETNVVTRAVGGHGQLFLDVVVFDICLGDTFLLCTDGLYRELKHQQIRDLLAAESVRECAVRLARGVPRARCARQRIGRRVAAGALKVVMPENERPTPRRHHRRRHHGAAR